MTAPAPAISRAAALRIGLAARALPDTSPKELLQVLLDQLGTPLTEEKLSHVTVTQLKSGLASPDGEEDTEHLEHLSIPHYKEAVRILWDESEDSNLPKPEAYAEGEMPGSVRIALASNAGARMDGHFGACLRFLAYQVAKDRVKLWKNWPGGAPAAIRPNASWTIGTTPPLA
jgi:hypothetical protein